MAKSKITADELRAKGGVVRIDELPARVQNETDVEKSRRLPGAPPGLGQFLIPHTYTVQGRASTFANSYRDPDEARRDSPKNAQYMRNELLIMECLEARMRATSLLNWHLEPEDDSDPYQTRLVNDLTAILKRTPLFMDMRYALMEAIWSGRTAVQHKYGWQRIRAQKKNRIVSKGWVPIMGDKLVFGWDEGDLRYWDDQVGIRVGAGFGKLKIPAWRHVKHLNKIRPSHNSLAYFLDANERKRVVVHKHIIEDGAFEDPIQAGSIHGVGIRSRIYWTWFQMLDAIAWLMEFLERSAFGIELWTFPQGNVEAEKAIREAAEERIQAGNRTIITIPVPMGEQSNAFGLERYDAPMAGAETLLKVISEHFGHKIKRYILGQTLTTESQPLGIGGGASDQHRETFMDIVRFDAQKLGETLSTEWVRHLLEWNFPDATDLDIRFVVDTEAPDLDRKLTAWQSAWNMGAKLKASDVLALIGASMPTEDDEVLQNPTYLQLERMEPSTTVTGEDEMAQAGAFVNAVKKNWVPAGVSRTGRPKERDPVTGQVRYLSMEGEPVRYQGEWQEETSERTGKPRWRHVRTGKLRYDPPPEEREPAEEEPTEDSVAAGTEDVAVDISPGSDFSKIIAEDTFRSAMDERRKFKKMSVEAMLADPDFGDSLKEALDHAGWTAEQMEDRLSAVPVNPKKAKQAREQRFQQLLDKKYPKDDAEAGPPPEGEPTAEEPEAAPEDEQEQPPPLPQEQVPEIASNIEQALPPTVKEAAAKAMGMASAKLGSWLAGLSSATMSFITDQLRDMLPDIMPAPGGGVGEFGKRFGGAVKELAGGAPLPPQQRARKAEQPPALPGAKGPPPIPKVAERASHEGEAVKYGWVANPGPRRKDRWTHTETGEHFYGPEPPGEGRGPQPIRDFDISQILDADQQRDAPESGSLARQVQLSTEALEKIEADRSASPNTYTHLSSENLLTVGERFATQIRGIKETWRGRDIPGHAQERLDRARERLSLINQEKQYRRDYYDHARMLLAAVESHRTNKIVVDDPAKMLSPENMTDVYYEAGWRPKHGRAPYRPELFVTSDLSGKKMRHYFTLPDGRRAHPDEIHAAKKRGRILVTDKIQPPIRDWTKGRSEPRTTHAMPRGHKMTTAQEFYSHGGEHREIITKQAVDPFVELAEQKKYQLPGPDDLSEEDRALGLAAKSEAEQGRNPPAWVKDESKWKRAKEIVEGQAAEYDEPWAVVTHIYKSLGGRIS